MARAALRGRIAAPVITRVAMALCASLCIAGYVSSAAWGSEHTPERSQAPPMMDRHIKDRLAQLAMMLRERAAQLAAAQSEVSRAEERRRAAILSYMQIMETDSPLMLSDRASYVAYVNMFRDHYAETTREVVRLRARAAEIEREMAEIRRHMAIIASEGVQLPEQ